ncbi:MAG: hypothetical protein M3373_04620 [Gemmatimonadota bacterium]|nr:hypothetical protein [Gemmatimonadota bacterium]
MTPAILLGALRTIETVIALTELRIAVSHVDSVAGRAAGTGGEYTVDASRQWRER